MPPTNSIDWVAFAALGQMVLDIRKLIVNEPAFAGLKISQATTGRILTLIMVRIATSQQLALSVADIAQKFSLPHSTATGYADWLMEAGLVFQRDDGKIQASNFDHQLLRDMIEILHADVIRVQGALRAVMDQIARDRGIQG